MRGPVTYNSLLDATGDILDAIGFGGDVQSYTRILDEDPQAVAGMLRDGDFDL